MSGLLRKELRALAPIALLGVLVMSGDLLYRPFTQRHDESSWTDIANYIEPGGNGGLGWVLLLLAVSVAYAAYPREHDEGTIALLHALPIRRSTIYLAKVGAGLLTLFAMVAALFLTDALQSNVIATSLEGGQWRFELALQLSLLQLAVCIVVYGHALLASVLRLFGLIPYAVFLLLANTLEDLAPPLMWANPIELLAARYDGRALVFPWAGLSAQLAIAALAYGLAYLAWAGPAARIGAAFQRLRASMIGKAAFGCASVLTVAFVALIAGMFLMTGLPGDDSNESATPSLETTEVRTERYLLTVPSALSARAEPLIDDADRLHEAVRARLGAEVGPELVADLTDTSTEHLGIAAWTTLRVGLAVERDPVRLKRTFTHETAHAFQHRITDGRHRLAPSATRFFAEGSAEHLAFGVVPDDEALARARIIAAATWRRHRMRFDDLADDTRLRARFDPMLVYPLGELWTAALVETYGDEALGDLLRAMGRSDAPKDLTPRAYWEDALRAGGYDLETVLAAFERRIATIAEDEREAIERLPRIGGGVRERAGARLVLEAVLDRDPPPGARSMVRVRSGPDARDTETFGVEGQPDPADPRRVTFRILSALLPSSRFQVLFSVLPEGSEWAFSESWQWASAP